MLQITQKAMLTLIYRPPFYHRPTKSHSEVCRRVPLGNLSAPGTVLIELPRSRFCNTALIQGKTNSFNFNCFFPGREPHEAAMEERTRQWWNWSWSDCNCGCGCLVDICAL